jgi:hypothetical protein
MARAILQDLKTGVSQFGTAIVDIVEIFVDADFPECLTTE